MVGLQSILNPVPSDINTSLDGSSTCPINATGFNWDKLPESHLKLVVVLWNVDAVGLEKGLNFSQWLLQFDPKFCSGSILTSLSNFQV